MPMSEPDERDMLNILEKPTLPKRASQAVFALQDFTELVQICGHLGDWARALQLLEEWTQLPQPTPFGRY